MCSNPISGATIHGKVSFDPERSWWFLTIPIWLALLALLFAVIYKYVFFDHNQGAFCYQGVPINAIVDSSLATPSTLSDFYYFSLGVLLTGALGEITPNHSAVRVVISVQWFLGVCVLSILVSLLATLARRAANPVSPAEGGT